MFEGFSATYNIFFLIALTAFLFGLSYWTYRNVSGLSKPVRAGLISLRALVFLILILLLLGPTFILEQENLNKPEIAVLLDNSQSAIIEKGEYAGESDYQKAIEELSLHDTSAIRFKTFAFDGDFYPTQLDSLRFDGTETDINKALMTFREQRAGEQAVILVSDGIYNKGRDPSYTAGRYSLPVFTLAVGDTSRLNDIVVQTVTRNRSGYKNTVSPVTASILNDNFPDTDITVQLRRDGDVIDEQVFQSDEQRSVYEARFELELEDAGLQQYEIHVPEVEGEWTTENNQEIFSIDVLDDKIRIMHMAFEIHPDVKALRSILREDQSIKLENRTWISGERFVEGSFPQDPDTLDLIILQGFPSQDIPNGLLGQITDFTQGKPVVLLSGPSVDFNLFTSLYGDLLPVRAESNPDKRDIRPIVNPEHQDHPVLELPAANLERAPPLYAPIQDLSSTTGSNILLKANYQGSELDIPILSTRTIGNYRSTLLNAHGFYRWYLSPDDQVRNYTVELINNIIKWTSSSPDSRLLDISPAKDMFEETEDVVLDAFLRNESGQEEDDAVIEVELDGDGLSERFYTMSNQGLGQYTLQMGNLPGGLYQFNASAKKGDTIIEERSGEFSVGSTNLEYVNTVRNDDFLSSISEQTGGAFFLFNEAGDLKERIRQEGFFEPQSQITTQEVLAYQNPIWFLFVLLLLSAEWIIRKVVALP